MGVGTHQELIPPSQLITVGIGFDSLHADHSYWVISSVAERLVYTEDVGSSTLSSPTIFGEAARTADGHRTVNPAHRNGVGSNPTFPTTSDP